MGNLSRRKGQRWERELVHVFARVFGPENVRRGLQFRAGREVPDVVVPAFWVEAKRGKLTNPRAALAQALRDAQGKGLWPIAVCRDDGEEPFVAMTLDDFLDLVGEWWTHRQK